MTSQEDEARGEPVADAGSCAGKFRRSSGCPGSLPTTDFALLHSAMKASARANDSGVPMSISGARTGKSSNPALEAKEETSRLE